jgi:hypothetical protein
MIQLERFGTNSLNGSQLFVLELPRVTDFPSLLNLSSRYFKLFIACDARQTSVNEIADAASSLIDQGVVYVCAWGADCERVHDIFDEMCDVPNLDQAERQFVMTTWHDDEDLDEALWFFLNAAMPEENYIEECQAEVIAVIGSRDWTEQIRKRLVNQDTLNRDVVGKDADD